MPASAGPPGCAPARAPLPPWPQLLRGAALRALEDVANMERVETDNKDRPIEDMYIEKTIVFVDPFTEVDEEVSCNL